MESCTAYPERPGEPDCAYYVRNGVCGFGNSCRFNHPPAPRSQLADQAGSNRRHFPERIGQPDCQYYLRTGDCKFGANCKYNHPQKRDGSSEEEVRLNLTGLPMWLGERKCVHYTYTGASKFGFSSKFHHSRPINGGAFISMPNYPVYTLGTYPFLDPISLPAIPPSYIMARGTYQLPGLRIPASTSYTPVILSSQWRPTGPMIPMDRTEQSSNSDSSTVGTCTSSAKPPPFVEDNFPEREGQPECQYFLKTGDCSFGAACKFHHPKGWTPLSSLLRCDLSSIGLPLRPGEPQCSFYMRYGICKFGPVCKFDHPILVPYYNGLGCQPVSNMTIGIRSAIPASKVNNSFVESSNGSAVATGLLKEQGQQGSAAVHVDNTPTSTLQGVTTCTHTESTV